MKKLPITLIYSRLVLGLIIVLLSILQVENYHIIAIVLFSIGLLTDVFDGIIARKLKVSTQRLRRLDSTIDLVFFLCVAVSTYLQCPDFFKSNALKLLILGIFEALTYIVCYIKLRKEIATHTIGAKFWTLILFVTIIEIILNCRSYFLFDLSFWVGIITRIEIIAILLTLKTWTNDVPTIYHSIKLRQGKEIKRNKMFNG